MKEVPIFNYLEHYRQIEPEILAAIRRVLESGRLILGPEVEAFEREFATFLGAPEGHSVGVGNGTDAIAITLRALGIGPGDEVITVANTAVPTVSAIREVGAIPVFCDVVADSCLMDLDQLASCITQRTRAVVPVHLFGNVVDIPRIHNIIRKREISIVEDCAQAHGAMLGTEMAGTMGDAAAFSFYPTKNLGAYGDGGLCFTRNGELAARMRSIRMYGFEGQYNAVREGVNSRLDELQAAILRVKLGYLARQLTKRRALAAIYDECLPAVVGRVRIAAEVQHAWHLYVVRVADRESIRSGLSNRGIASAVHYPFPIHQMKSYEFLGYAPGSLPVTEALAGQIISLPMYPELPGTDARRVCDAMTALLGDAV
ncbi:DegT/DnrJ/EryC1/StrS family aminotransferase [Pseudomonadota bacterium]